MKTIEHGSGGSPIRPVSSRRPSRKTLLGLGLVIGGMALAFICLVAAIGGYDPLWTEALFFGGLGAVPVGAGILAWSAVKRFRRYGVPAAIFAALGAIVLAAVLAVVTVFLTAILTQALAWMVTRI
jgi:peptidoglycan/LPS O-acetylase OafA/YrhL